MNDQQYFMTASLSYQLKAAQHELASFRSGEAYVKLRADYEKIIREKDITIKQLQKERDDFSFSRKEITRQWMEALEDVEKEYEKEIKKLKQVIAELLDMVASLKNRNSELGENRKKYWRIIMKQPQNLRMHRVSSQSSRHRSATIMKIHRFPHQNASTGKRLPITGRRREKSPVHSRVIHTIHAGA